MEKKCLEIGIKCLHQILIPTKNVSPTENKCLAYVCRQYQRHNRHNPPANTPYSLLSPISYCTTKIFIVGCHTHSFTTLSQPQPTCNQRRPTKNDEMPIRHRRLFFWPDKVSCLIVVLLVLAALTPHRPSSAYPSAAAQQSATISTGGPLR